ADVAHDVRHLAPRLRGEELGVEGIERRGRHRRALEGGLPEDLGGGGALDGGGELIVGEDDPGLELGDVVLHLLDLVLLGTAAGGYCSRRLSASAAAMAAAVSRSRRVASSPSCRVLKLTNSRSAWTASCAKPRQTLCRYSKVWMGDSKRP